MITVRTAFTLAAPLALALAATPMIAQAPAVPGQPDKARVTAGNYAADPNHSLVAWSVNHLGFNDYFGLFGDVSAKLTLDPANLSAAKVTATIPVSKVLTANAGLTAHLLRPGSAVLLVERRSFAQGRPVEFTISTYRGDRYQLHVGLDVTLPPLAGALGAMRV